MANAFDLLIQGGTLVDGTGAAARTCDLGIRNGRIAALGRVGGPARRTLDAKGLVVAPGFVDIHTHYDAQLFWDRSLSPSSWHGVTSVVIGNCGFGIAPTRPAHRDLMLRTLESVEGMSLAALRSGLGGEWGFETFPEYLSAIESRGIAINVGALLGHTPLRTYVMGEDAVARESTVDELLAMQRLALEGLEAGALGFSTSKSPTHVGYAGNPVPSRAATSAEIRAIAGTLAEVPHGVFQATIGPGLSFDEFTAIAKQSGKPVSWTALLSGFFGPKGHRGILERHAKLQSQGIRVIPQVSCRPLTLEFQFRSPFPLESMAEMRPVSSADFAGRKALYADRAFRESLKPRIDEGGLRSRFYGMVLSEYAPDPSLVERSVEELAAERGIHPVDLALDLSLETNLEARFRLAAANTDDEDVAELLAHPAAMLGLSDAGAHASQLCDAGAPTTLLGKWVREKRALTLEEGVRRLTSEPADVFGIRDRGRLAEGLAADVAIFDLATVGCKPVRRVYDFPAGADRLVADAAGIRFVIVNGRVIRENDRDVAGDVLPGRVLRGGQA